MLRKRKGRYQNGKHDVIVKAEVQPFENGGAVTKQTWLRYYELENPIVIGEDGKGRQRKGPHDVETEYEVVEVPVLEE